MKFDNFTLKAQEAVQQAVERATGNGQQAIHATHLLAGVLAVGENVTQFIFGKTGVNASRLEAAVNAALQSGPRVQGGEPYLDREANEVLNKAQQLAQKAGDSFVGLEPLLMALLDVKSTAAQLLKDAGLTMEGLQAAVKELRGGKKADSATSEDSYQALAKYARNLVEEARNGKLDPV
ncbi:ATP-dependent chaperone protein ClpB, partial [gut metagenome]